MYSTICPNCSHPTRFADRRVHRDADGTGTIWTCPQCADDPVPSAAEATARRVQGMTASAAVFAPGIIELAATGRDLEDIADAMRFDTSTFAALLYAWADTAGPAFTHADANRLTTRPDGTSYLPR